MVHIVNAHVEKFQTQTIKFYHTLQRVQRCACNFNVRKIFTTTNKVIFLTFDIISNYTSRRVNTYGMQNM